MSTFHVHQHLGIWGTDTNWEIAVVNICSFEKNMLEQVKFSRIGVVMLKLGALQMEHFIDRNKAR